MKCFSEDHVWVHIQQGIATVGISSYAAEELGELTFIELPETGAVLGLGDVLCVVESVKAASDIISPVGGTVGEVNTTLETEPALVNASPEQDAWICRLEDIDPDELEGLMTEDDYEAYLGNSTEE